MSRKILLADDSLTIQKVVELTFMEGDFEVTAVSNGDEALSKLSEMSPDVVIADVHMPGADGFEICRTAKQRYPGVPVLLLVGTFEPFEDSAAQEAGADSHLKKPFDSQELLRLVEDLLSAAGGQVPGEIEELESISPDDFGEDLGGVFGAGQSLESEAAVADEPQVEVATGEQRETFSEEVAVRESTGAGTAGLSDEDVDRIARRVVQLMSDQTVREISWDVIPDLAEILIKDRIRELESQLE
jgi:CheY-like chemotaxis protein